MRERMNCFFFPFLLSFFVFGHHQTRLCVCVLCVRCVCVFIGVGCRLSKHFFVFVFFPTRGGPTKPDHPPPPPSFPQHAQRFLIYFRGWDPPVWGVAPVQRERERDDQKVERGGGVVAFFDGYNFLSRPPPPSLRPLQPIVARSRSLSVCEHGG